MAPMHSHSTQQPQPGYKRKHLLSPLPPAPRARPCSAVTASRGPVQVLLFSAASPPSPPGSSIPGKPTAATAPAAEHLKTLKRRGPVKIKGSSLAPVLTPPHLFRGCECTEPWCPQPRCSALPSICGQNMMPRCPGVGVSVLPHPTPWGVPTVHGQRHPSSWGGGDQPRCGGTRGQMGRAVHCPRTQTPTTYGPPAAGTSGVPQCPPQPHQGFAAAPTALFGLAQATVTPSPGASPSLPTLSCCWGLSMSLRSSSIPRPSGVGTSCAR